MDLWAWMERLGQDDHEALEHLLAHYDGMLRYIISGMLSDPQDQEDCLAQVRAKLWEGRHQYDREKASPTTWLTALCRNTAYDHLRAQHRRGFPEELDPAVPTRPPDRRRRCFKRSGSSVCRRHWTSCPPGTAPSSTANITTSSPLPGLPPSWAPQNGQWRESSTASANACKPC